MEELVKRVSEQAGISEEQARSAVNTVAEFLKEKVPAPFTGYIDNFMGTGGGSGAPGGISSD
jgi:nucleoid DNA-binding protein